MEAVCLTTLSEYWICIRISNDSIGTLKNMIPKKTYLIELIFQSLFLVKEFFEKEQIL